MMSAPTSKSKQEAKKEWPCTVCGFMFFAQHVYENHCQGKKHKKMQAMSVEKQAAECTVFVSSLQGLRDKEGFLTSYFSKYGKVKVKTGSRPDFAFVQFENQESAKDVCKHKFHEYMDYRFLVREYIFTDPTQQNKEKKKEREEELQTLTKSLSAAQNLSQQFVMMCDQLVLSQQDKVIRMEICRHLTRTFYNYFEICSVHQFGSSINGYGMMGCDLDLFLDFNVAADCPGTGGHKVPFEIPFKPKGIKGLSTRTAPLSPSQVDEMEDLDKVKFVCQVLRSSRQPFSELMVIPSKRCPLVRFVHRPTGLKCDLSLNNRKALYNSRLLRLYSQDPRVQQMVIVVRYWARVQKLSCSEGTGNLFTSYALTWLVIYFLMQRKPRVVPLVNELLSLPTMKTQEVCEEMVDLHRCLVVPLDAKLPQSQNQETTANLLSEFFQFYASKVDWESQALSTYDGSVVPRQSLEQNAFYAECKVGCMTIFDPFVLTHNIVANVTDTTRDRFVSEMKKAAEVVKSWSRPELMAPSGSNKRTSWGVTDILKPSPVEKKPHKSNKKDKGRIEGEQDNKTFLLNFLPDAKLLSSEQLIQLSEKEGIAPGLLWCRLVHRLILNVLESVFHMDVNVNDVSEPEWEKELGGEGKDKNLDNDNDDINDDLEGEERIIPPTEAVKEKGGKMECVNKETDGGGKEEGHITLNDELEGVNPMVEDVTMADTDESVDLNRHRIQLLPMSHLDAQTCCDASEPTQDRNDTTKRLSQSSEENSSKRCRLHSGSEDQIETIETGSEDVCGLQPLAKEQTCETVTENKTTELINDDTSVESSKAVKSEKKIEKTKKLDSSSSSTKKLEAKSDPMKETLKKVVGDLKMVSKVCSYACLTTKSLWSFRVKVRQSLANNKRVEGLELEREISRQVLIKIEQDQHSSDGKSKISEKKNSGNSNQLQSSPSSGRGSGRLEEEDKKESDKFDQPGTSLNCTISEKQRKVLDKLEQLRSCQSPETEKKSEKTHDGKSTSHYKALHSVSDSKDTSQDKTHNKDQKTESNSTDYSKVERSEWNSRIVFTITIVECRYASSSHPRVVVILHPQQDQLNHFRNFFTAASGVITKLVSCHLLDNEL